MTFSIVARDPETGELGVAVTTCVLGVGSVVPWVRPGAGAVATQSLARRSYGPLGLDLLGAGVAPDEALARLTAEDPEARRRQVGMVDAGGRSAAFTGESCVPHAAHVGGDGFTAQGNLLRTSDVVPAVARGYETASGSLAQRLLAALDAGEAAGGDLRGRQSAALLVLPGEAGDEPWEVEGTDLRVDDAPDPLGELRRLLDLQIAYDQDEHRTLARLAPAGSRELHAALADARAGEVDSARGRIGALLENEPGWRAYLELLAELDQLPNAKEILAR